MNEVYRVNIHFIKDFNKPDEGQIFTKKQIEEILPLLYWKQKGISGNERYIIECAIGTKLYFQSTEKMFYSSP